MRFKKESFRLTVRLLVLLSAIFLLFSGPLPVWLLQYFYSGETTVEEISITGYALLKYIPQTSNFSYIVGVLSGKSFVLMGLLASVVFLSLAVIAFYKGRFFCRWVCPLGTLYYFGNRVSLKKTFLKKRVSGYIFWSTVSASALGIPLFAFLDPLSGFSRIGVLLNNSIAWPSLILLSIILVFLVLGLVQPMIWCSMFCPLGYFFTLIVIVKKSLAPGKALLEKVDTNKREIIGGLLTGALAASLIKYLGRSVKKRIPVLPPGAGTPERFESLCTRCYACVNACPSGTITVKMPRSGDSVAGWLAPQVDASRGPCEEFCYRCSEVCPTGAIKKILSTDEKRHIQMGIAEVRRDACLAWTDKEHCMVCDEYCPYRAIANVPDEKGIPCPVIKPDVCRGCGYCEKYCPAVRDGIAIVVKGVPEQKMLKG